jgi:hypothetical protein
VVELHKYGERTAVLHRFPFQHGRSEQDYESLSREEDTNHGVLGRDEFGGSLFTHKRGICIDFGRMNKILKLHKEDLDVIVQPGLGWELLNEELAEEGLFFPLIQVQGQ